MDATEMLMSDHRAVRGLFGRFNRSSREETRRDLAAEIIRELSLHAAVEEAKLYPVMRKEMPGGERFYEESIAEHQKMKEILGDLDGRLDKAHTKAFADRMERLRRDVEHHVEEEEGEVFPRLRESLGRARLREIGEELEKAKESAPTRPHPNQPPATELTGKAVGAMDRMRDRLTGR
jgi:hemerythrin superfamily protein